MSNIASTSHPASEEQRQDMQHSVTSSSNAVRYASASDLSHRANSPKVLERRKKTKRRRVPELKIVYRTLRFISDLALSGFFTEVTPCHHNEIIDIATLSATIPHRRIIAYWAKASMFKNPVSRSILRSAGAIPVARVAQSQVQQDENQPTDTVDSRSRDTVPKSSGPKGSSNGQQALFDATYRELAKPEGGGGVLGVFPEGTSYTMPRIVQVKEGAARAALGYMQWWQERNGDNGSSEIPVSVVPVGIVYTDKSRYRSRLFVRYGTPIDLRPFVKRAIAENNGGTEDNTERYHTAIREVTAVIKKGMLELTINASDWDTLYATQTARAILWTNDRDLQLQDFVKASKTLVRIFEPPSTTLIDLRQSLLDYHALSYHTGLSHAALAHVPFPPPPSPSSAPIRTSGRTVLTTPSLIKLIAQLPPFLAPALLSLPTHIAHVPAYAFGALSSRLLAGEEEEARAQYKVLIGGAGRVIGTVASGFVLIRSVSGRSLVKTTAKAAVEMSKSAFGMVGRALSVIFPGCGGAALEEAKENYLSLAEFALEIVKQRWAKLGEFGNVISILGVAWLLCVWHNRVIDANYMRYKRVRATLAILRAVLFSRRAEDVKKDDLKPYLTTPPPPLNPYIAKSLQTAPKDAIASPPVDLNLGGAESTSDPLAGRSLSRRVAKSVLVRQLLLARATAVQKLSSTLRELETQAESVDVEDRLSGEGRSGLTEKEGRWKKGIAGELQILRDCGAEF
ncbi:uncharacterized protein FOMMEDRAFT_164667 [Fomitiporia mediterranea MF3/22]|uniref:uncharacterized protein n=1 Tax=Fomitiporia mediterranea (strain MF3/22) TaxID=694068 RepID=UPI0004408205|nr:uncharacterized protein FOMMEDRAFT_164667 [Fomitiporia mediterranea MF3/22]EJD07789.1 hypothetical protein FOMMEDRAFT_164667 [Fomitiporia mediterranea MF3/22]